MLPVPIGNPATSYQQFKDILTPGTPLYKSWCTQVDSIAFYLKKLQDAHVPVLWRPYHEMNGGWFWWGGRIGKYSTFEMEDTGETLRIVKEIT